MATSATTTIGDAVNWSKGSYLVYLSPWGAGSLVRGKDYWNTATVTGDLFPNKVTMNWQWPDKVPTTSGVYNFNAIDFGNSFNAVVPTPIKALQVNSIGTLTQTHNFTLGGDTSKYDVITDFWLTQKAGDFTNRLFEVEVSLHTPAYGKAYFLSATPVGTYTDAQGQAWTVTIDRKSAIPDILIMPKGGGDLVSGTVDIKGMLDWLVAQKVITGNEYFNGLAMGAEVRQGAGSLTVNNFNVDYAAKAATAPVTAPSAPEAVKVPPAPNHAPVIDSNGGGTSAALSVASGAAAVTSVHATDADGTALTYAITGGADASLFTIDAKTGALAFKAAPSFAAPKDVGGDNVYNVTVKASDGSLTDSQDITVSVTNTSASVVFKGGPIGTQSMTLTTDHYDASWKMTRTSHTDVVTFDGAKQWVEGHDAAGKLTGYALTQIADGKEQVQHWDAKWVFTGADVVTYGAKTVTDHYDAAWKATGHDIFFIENGKAVEQHYDANWKLTGADTATRAAGGNIVIDQYDANWKSTGHENIVNDGAKLTTQHYDANWKFVSADVETLAAAKVLNHDSMKAWLMA
jgi:hypothetical protein